MFLTALTASSDLTPSGAPLGAPQEGILTPNSSSPFRGNLPAGSPLRLLVVEDNPSTLSVMVRLLRAAGHQVFSAQSVAQALAAAAAHPLDLVVSDVGLPDGTGHEMMKELRARHGLRGVVLSGYGMEQDIARSRDAGFVAHLVKPVQIDELLRILATVPRRD